jgi:hypothetical protein
MLSVRNLRSSRRLRTTTNANQVVLSIAPTPREDTIRSLGLAVSELQHHIRQSADRYSMPRYPRPSTIGPRFRHGSLR